MEPAATAEIEVILQTKLSKNIRDLGHLLSSFITEKGDQNTNIINVIEKRTYNVPESHIESFFSLLEACRKEGRMLHYSERQETQSTTHSGIMLDFDRYQLSSEREIEDTHIHVLLGKIFSILLDSLEFPVGKQFYHAFVISKPSVVPVEGKPGLYKDGFHLLLPEIQVLKGFKKYLIQELLNKRVMENVFSNIPHINGAAEMLDKASTSVPVHFLGNSKPMKKAYPISHAYKVEMTITEYPLDTEYIFRKPVALPLDPKYNLCKELSLVFPSEWLQKRHFAIKPALETKVQLITEKATAVLDEDDILACDGSVDILTIGNAEAKYIKQLLEILDISYATEYCKWFKVMCAIAHTSAQYRPLGIYFSHRRPVAFSMDEFDRVWDEALAGKCANPVTKRSIVHWARKSSPERFAEIEKVNYMQAFARAVYEYEGCIEHSVVAKIASYMIGDKFVACDVPDGVASKNAYCWYEFVIPGQSMKKGEIWKWRFEHEPDNIHLFIGEHMPKLYTEQLARLKDRRDNAKDEPEAKYLSNLVKTLSMYKTKLCNNGFQTGVVKQAIYRFRNRNFASELDKQTDIIGVGNGIIKLGPEPRLIKGFHEYKVSKYTSVNYVPYNPNNKYTQDLLAAFSDIFPEPDVLNYMLCHGSSGLDACESSCIMTLLVGGGRNGKTFFMKMIHNTLENMYCASGKSALLTSPTERGDTANSAQMQMRGKRYFYFDEFNKYEQINIARMKSIANPGWQSGRDLFEAQSNFKNTCNPIAASNYDFSLETTDHGTWRRVYYYRNKTKFCEKPDPKNPNEKLVRLNLLDHWTNDDNYKEAMLSILVEWNRRLRTLYNGNLGNVPVPTIMRETEMFRDRQDFLNMFITKYVIHSTGAPDISITTIAKHYIEWHKGYNKKPTTAALTGADVEAQLENSRLSELFITVNDVKILRGYRVKTTLEETLGPDESPLTRPSTVHSAGPVVVPEFVSIPTKKTLEPPIIEDTLTHVQRRPTDTTGEDESNEDFFDNLFRGLEE